MEEKYQKHKQLLVKREQLLKQLQEGCLASRVTPGGEASIINEEQAKKCHSFREEMEGIDEEIEGVRWINEPKHESGWENEEKH